MKTNQILIGGGLIAIGLYLYNKNKKAKSVETPSTGGESPLPPPDKMPTPVPDIPKEEEVTTSVYYCKDGFREVVENRPNVKMEPPCRNHGGIDELKTKNNQGGGVHGSSTPIGKKCPEGQEFRRGGGSFGAVGGSCVPIGSPLPPSTPNRGGSTKKMSCTGAVECKDFKCPEGYYASWGRGIVMSANCIKSGSKPSGLKLL